MKAITLAMLVFSQMALAVSPKDFNKELMKGVREDIQQDRFQEKKEVLRKPASFEREETPDQLELQRKNRVNGLHQKW